MSRKGCETSSAEAVSGVISFDRFRGSQPRAGESHWTISPFLTSGVTNAFSRLCIFVVELSPIPEFLRSLSSFPAKLPRMKFGAHMPTSGGVWRALQRGTSIGCEIVQIFVKNNMQWFGKPHPPEHLALYAN